MNKNVNSLNFEFVSNDYQTYDGINVALALFVLKRTNKSKIEFNELADKLNNMSEQDVLNLVNKNLVLKKLNEVATSKIKIENITFQVNNEQDEIQILFDAEF